MNKALGVIALIVGLVSAIIGLYQTFLFSHLPQVRARYACGGGHDTNVMEFLRDLDVNSGQVVMLDFNMCASDFNREVRGSAVTRFFDGETFLQAAGVDTKRNWPRSEAEWDRATSVIDDRLSVGVVSMRDISRDNGMRVTLSGIGQTANPFSSLTEGSEGVDNASGPFQISIVSQYESFEYMISPAPVTDRLAAEVRCARRDWPAFAKALACPFF
jgi:hypothetical protein